ncbi:hypothetical protein [Vreelandella zhaodongensis]|nr:hypothetical protein [Halomonas zhaodongensis]
MNMSLRQLFAPALLAMALMPMAFSAQAGHHKDHDGHGYDRAQMAERMQERRQDAYQRAELSEEQRAALDEAHAEHRDAMLSLREEHHARVAEILTEEEQQALRNAMHEIHAEAYDEKARSQRGHGKHRHGNHSEPAEETSTE